MPRGVYPRTVAHNAANAAAQSGKVQSAESKAKKAEALRGNQNGLGYTHTDEARASMSATRTGRPHSLDHRLALNRSRAKWHKDHLTVDEQKMASILTEGGIQFEVQVPIWLYRVDFLVWPNIIIEIDGRRHKSHREVSQNDAIKDRVLKALGFQVIRVLSQSLEVT